MGEANRRGTFEQRQAKALIKKQEDAEAYERAMVVHESSLTPAQRKARMKNLQLLAYLSGIGYMK